MRAKFINIEEGVGDKYLQNHYGIKDEDTEFEKKYQNELAKKSLIPIGSFVDEMDEIANVYKNPPSLKYLQMWVRACSDDKGNLYVADSQDIMHWNLEDFLKNQGISSKSTYQKTFMDWQRHKDTDVFYVAEGYDLELVGLNLSLSKEEKQQFKEYSQAVIKRNPQIKFVYNKTIIDIDPDWMSR
jgi:hypothetical protein